MIRILKKFNLFLNGRQKIRIVVLVILMIIGGLLETVGISMMIPLMTTIMNSHFFETNKYAVYLAGLFHLHTPEDFLVLILLSIVVIYFVKNGFLFFEYYVQTRFVCNNRVLTQKMMMETYLHRPYEYFLTANSGEIIRVITDDVKVSFSMLMFVLQFLTELIVSITLLLAVIAIDWQMALIIMVVLAIEMLIIYKIIKPVLQRAGIDRMKMEAMANKWTLQSIMGIKEIKVSRKEDFFLRQYSKYAQRSVAAEKLRTVLDNLPRILIETFTIAAMLVSMAVLIRHGRSLEQLMPQLSAFAVAAVRILPSANRISSAANAMAFTEPVLDKTIENLTAIRELEGWTENVGPAGHLLFEKRCELHQITFAYPNAEQEVLKNADMVIPFGRSVGVIGTSGAGKTTAVDIMLGLLHQAEGDVLVDGKSTRDHYADWLSMISYIPQMIYMLDDTIRANVAFGCEESEIDDNKVWEALEEAQLKEFVESLPDQLDTEIGERGIRVSGGQRQRIGIARALYTDPKLLIFDEATSALDNETEAAVMESVNALHGRKTMVIIAHRLTTIQGCDLVYRVEDGRIVRER